MANEEVNPEDMAKAMDSMVQLIELAAGYKARAMDAGFDEATASEMAADIHAALASNVLSTGKK